MISVSRMLVLSSPNFFGVLPGIVGFGFLDFRDFPGALFIGYYMHFLSHLANGVEPVKCGFRRRMTADAEAWLGDLT